MGLVIIPENYDDLPKALAPICIEDRDTSGNPINPKLIDDGVRTIHRPLCHLTARILSDVRLVSELVDNAVQYVWRIHRDKCGDEARKLIYARAKWEAKEMRAGGWAIRRRRQVSLNNFQCVETTDARIRVALQNDPRNSYEARLDLEVLSKLASDEELRAIIELYAQSWTFDEIGALLGRKPNTLVQKFVRWKDTAREQYLKEKMRRPERSPSAF